MTSSKPTPTRLYRRSQLSEVYGISGQTIAGHARRKVGLIAPPDAESGTGPLWSSAHVERHRVTPNPDVAAISPIDANLGGPEFDNSGFYLCPDKTGSHIGWAAPSVIGLYGTGGVTNWYDVVGIARYGFDESTSSSATSTLSAAVLREADEAVRQRHDADRFRAVAVFVLDTSTRKGPGQTDLFNKDGSRIGLRNGRLLAVRRTKGVVEVGGGDSWLDLSAKQLTPFVPPTLDVAFPY